LYSLAQSDFGDANTEAFGKRQSALRLYAKRGAILQKGTVERPSAVYRSIGLGVPDALSIFSPSACTLSIFIVSARSKTVSM
jgi:hypothetical protein